MKTKQALYNLMFLCLFFIGNSAFSQYADDLDFKVILEKLDNGIKLKCQEGCAWTELTFEVIENNVPQAINAYGMVDLNEKPSKINNKLPNFLFTVEKTEQGLSLKGLDGTAWTALSFTLLKKERQAIDQSGMTVIN